MASPDMTGIPVCKDRGIVMMLTRGRVFYPLDPRPEEVFIQDIAQSLSRTIRYNGLSDGIINVAQHSVNSAWLAEQEHQPSTVQLAMLMHDAPEYVVGDMIRPLKSLFPGFTVIEDNIMSVINERFELPTISHKLQKHYDNLALHWEKRDLYQSASPSHPWPKLPPLPEGLPILTSWTADFSEMRFLEMFTWLRHDVRYNNA